MNLVENKNIKWNISLHRYLIYFPAGAGGNFLLSLTAKFLGYDVPTKFSATGNSHDHGNGEWKIPLEKKVCMIGDYFEINYRPNCMVYAAHQGPLLELKEEYGNLKIIMITAQDNEDYWNIARMMTRKAWPIFLTYPGEYERLKGADWPEYEDNLPNKSKIVHDDVTKISYDLTLNWYKKANTENFIDYKIKFKTIFGLDDLDLAVEMSNILDKPVTSNIKHFIDEYQHINKGLYFSNGAYL